MGSRHLPSNSAKDGWQIKSFFIMSRFNTKGLEILIGIPGSGKSTYLRTIEDDNLRIVCPDQIRKELTGNISDQSKNGEVWKLAEEEINNLLSEGFYVVLDATNVNTSLRRALLDRIKENNPGVETYATIFSCDPEESKRRISADIETGVDRANVPAFIIDRMYSQYLETIYNILSEGFTEIFFR